jgi:hypothetical protein
MIELFDAVKRSPELHFESLTQQLEDANIRNLKVGDFVITKHSNIPCCHVIFHLVVNDESIFLLSLGEIHGRCPLIQGYRTILQICHLTHITQLVVPFYLYTRESPSLKLEFLLKRAEVILKQSKGLFNEMARNSRIEKVPRQFHFLIPLDSSQKAAFSHIHEQLSLIFRTM